MRLIFPGITYSKPGGTENLIAQIIETAQLEHCVSSVVIGSEDSYLVRKLISEKIKFVFLSYQEIDDFVFEKTDLWVHTHNSILLLKVKDKPGRAILWAVLAKSVIDWNRFRFEIKLTGRKLFGDFLTRRLINCLINKDALLAMDGATIDAMSKFLGCSADIPILPVAIETIGAPLKLSFNEVEGKKKIVSYIGRSDDIWKIKPIKKILTDLQKLPEKFTVNIYTDDRKPFDQELSSLHNSNIKIQYCIGLFGDRLRSHLVQHSDIHFSMGLSALEGAVCQIPTIVVDACCNDLPENYRYRWLYQTERCSLGQFIDDKTTLLPGMSMEAVIDTIKSHRLARSIAEQSRQYVIRNHSPSYITQKLLNVCSTASNYDIVSRTPSAWAVSRIIRKALKVSRK